MEKVPNIVKRNIPAAEEKNRVGPGTSRGGRSAAYG